eukprot:CAMPEP_0113578166 /NCGR_PEP_ID=MMETSP0015_2-20120614/29315_1 /TAXON_ID=2838 /ORGANISM="Odontella" /LENGTH=171 /DNA_ID=CAMNT_0000481911 /DNA_START=53 /DNA_END=568 /DNA_ORIENTATION=+ /assembly_acc=CAM_ASM_000160
MVVMVPMVTPQSPPKKQTIRLDDLVKRCPPAPKKKHKSRRLIFGGGDTRNDDEDGDRRESSSSPPSLLPSERGAQSGREAINFPLAPIQRRDVTDSPPQISRLSLADNPHWSTPDDSPPRAVTLFHEDDDLESTGELANRKRDEDKFDERRYSYGSRKFSRSPQRKQSMPR